MAQQDTRIGDSQFSKWIEDGAPQDDREIVRLSAARARAMDEAGTAIARQLNGPLTALLLYIGEIKQHSHQLSQSSGDRIYLQQVVENALQQTERVCAMMKQIAATHDGPFLTPGRKAGWETRTGLAKDGIRTPGVMFSSGAGQKPLTKREREVLNPTSKAPCGCVSAQGPSKVIAPRRCESLERETRRTWSAPRSCTPARCRRHRRNAPPSWRVIAQEVDQICARGRHAPRKRRYPVRAAFAADDSRMPF